ncbi:MAG: preprotein translocase subunit YajC [Moraxellaceae bacterium]|jgi:preprotein translocase subunit YajC|nr:preprotein translocase subunit YajC [Moraxellaceae bacterium]
MSLFIANAYAANGAAPAGPSAWGQIIMLGVFALVFYFLLLRPQLKRQKEHKSLMEALQKGDEVVFAGGLVGSITKVDGDFAVIELANNVEVKVQRSAVVATLPKGTIKNI